MTDEHLSRRSRAVFGILGTAVLASGAAFAVMGVTPDHSGSTYYNAVFGRAGQGLDQQSDVKVRGIAVGGIDSVRLGHDGRVNVRIRLDKGVRVTRTATATIEAVSVFGPKDMTIDMGTDEGKGPYLPDGGTIAKTEDPLELADTAWPTYRLTSAINPADIASIVHTFSQGLRGQGPALRRTVDNGATLVDLTYGNRAQIRQLIDDVAALSGTFAGRGGTITKIAGDFNATSGVVADRPDKVAELLGEAGTAAEQVGGTLQRHGDDIAELIDGGSEVVDVFYRQRGEIPVLIDGLNGFFGLLSSIIRVPGPEGTLLAQIVSYIPLDVCKTIADICQSEPPNSFLRLTGGRR